MQQDADTKNMKTDVEARVKKEAEQRTKGTKSGGKMITPEFIQKCFKNNELGDGNIFKKLYRNDFVYNKANLSWLYWDGHHWSLDTMDNALSSVDGVAAVYEDEAARLYKEEIQNKNAIDDNSGNDKGWDARSKKFFKRAALLRSTNRRKNCLAFVHTSKEALSIQGDELDKKPWSLPCKNGVINLKAGDVAPGRQRDFLLKASPVEWKGINEKCPTWEKTLSEIFSEDQGLIDFFHRICGQAIVGEVVDSIMVVLTGQGRNGKTLIVETLSKVLGPLSGVIPSEMLLDQARSNSGGPTPDIMSLRGLRLAFASETDAGCRISPSRVKWLTGNDTITGRHPHDKYSIQFEPSHTLFLLTNHKPHAPADDFAFWERMVIIPFDLSFVNRKPRSNTNERRADLHLSKKIQKELPGILAWMVRGCLLWQDQGLNPPEVVKKATEQYRRDEDMVADFIDDCCITGQGLSVGATPLYKRFEIWWKANISNNIPKQKTFGTWMNKKYEKIKYQTMIYKGISLIDDEYSLPPG